MKQKQIYKKIHNMTPANHMLSLGLSFFLSLLPDTLRNVSFCVPWQWISVGWLSEVSVATDGYQPYLLLINLTKGSYSMLRLNSVPFRLSLSPNPPLTLPITEPT